MSVILRIAAFTLFLLAAGTPARAQWSRITQVPAAGVFSVWANGDTVIAGADSIAYLSTDGGASWKTSAVVAPGVLAVEAVRVRNRRLYVGTYGQGVFVSDDLGDSWLPYSQGLLGGIANSQLYIRALLFRGDSLFAATSGDGPWVRNLATGGNWSRYGNALEANQSANMNAIAAGGSRLLAAGGFNGTVFFRDPGQTDWTLSWLNNTGPAPGLAALSAVWTGHSWLVGSNVGVLRSPQGQSPWTNTGPGLGTLFTVDFALHGTEVFAAFGLGGSTSIQHSVDDGVTWLEVENLPATFFYGMTMRGTELYAARFDGLWRRPIGVASVPGAETPARLRFAVAGAHPIRDGVRFRFQLPAAGSAVIELFDLTGRRVAEPIAGEYGAGPSEVAWNARALSPGVYSARLSAAGRSEIVRLVRLQ